MFTNRTTHGGAVNSEFFGDPGSKVGEHPVEIRVPAGCLLGIDQILVQLHLEDAPSGGKKRDPRDPVFELCQYQVRQTDGSRCIASLGAVFDRNLHVEECTSLHLPNVCRLREYPFRQERE